MAKERASLTERDHYWLRHQKACDRSGLTAKAYARQHRLSIHALYQARKRLRALGALEVGGAQASKARPRPSGAFARVAVAATRPRFRVRLANGALVEWEGAAGVDELAQVLGTVSQLG